MLYITPLVHGSLSDLHKFGLGGLPMCLENTLFSPCHRVKILHFNCLVTYTSLYQIVIAVRAGVVPFLFTIIAAWLQLLIEVGNQSLIGFHLILCLLSFIVEYQVEDTASVMFSSHQEIQRYPYTQLLLPSHPRELCTSARDES